MPVDHSQDPFSATSVTSEDRQPQSRFTARRSRPVFGSGNSSWKAMNSWPPPANNGPNESLGLQAKLAEALQCEEWDSLTQADAARGYLFSDMRIQIERSLKALNHIGELENVASSGAVPNPDLVSRRESHDVESHPSTRTREYINQVHSQHGSEASTEWKLEVKRWKRVDGRTGSMDIYDDTQKIEDIRKREREIQGGGHVLNLFDVYSSEGSECRRFLEISSGPLVDLLRDVITFYPGEEFDILKGGNDAMGNAITFADPFVMLFANRKKLEQSLHGNYPEEAKQHLEVLLKFLKTEHPYWSGRLTTIEEGRCKKITFHSLWLLYLPGTPIYVCGGADDRQIVVYSTQVEFHGVSTGATRQIRGALTLKCWDVKYERGTFRRTFSNVVIEPYSGAMDIEQLPYVPSGYMPNEEAVNNRLIARGRKYFHLKQTAQMQDYDGDYFPRVFKDEPIRVIVDEDTYRRKNPYQATPFDKTSQTYGFPAEQASLVDEKNDPLDTTLLRCFPELGVFSLRDRQWGLVKVDDLQPVQFREKAFARLVMKKDHKNLLKALVRAYMQESAYFRDIVPGKGRGIAILLHGPPGTGKTLTAECVAEREQRPLYTISCGDLGTEPEQLEARLKEVFEHAVLWKAILLLDEADIFLQERNINDLKRNALVTIFLRELEYFDGIIFMTTNRPGDIDEAFVSRLHVTIELSQPQREDRLKIWKMFIKDLDMPEEDQSELFNYAKKFEGDNLNGRQIRNTIRVAMALAKSRNSHVKPEDLGDVVKISREYAQYNENLNKMPSEDFAIQQGKRAAKEEERG